MPLPKNYCVCPNCNKNSITSGQYCEDCYDLFLRQKLEDNYNNNAQQQHKYKIDDILPDFEFMFSDGCYYGGHGMTGKLKVSGFYVIELTRNAWGEPCYIAGIKSQKYMKAVLLKPDGELTNKEISMFCKNIVFVEERNILNGAKQNINIKT